MKKSKLNQAIPAISARRIYDFIGKRYDWFASFDSRAKERAIQVFNPVQGEHLLEIGVGTGKVLVEINKTIAPGGMTFGIDLSRVMLNYCHQQADSQLCQADARNIPFTSGYFEGVFTSYVLDLIPHVNIPRILAEVFRVLRPGGRLVVVALTEGVDLPSRSFVSIWKTFYSISPIICAGCRPIQLYDVLNEVGFNQVKREVLVQLAVPSEIISALK
jgi:ubiquinone/menaquinone biosynthesis C-methylase UbiE